VTQSCPTDHAITIYEAETGLIPDLDALPPLGCFSVRYLSKLDRKDFKLSPKNQAGVFVGFATLRNGTYGSILLIGDRCIVVAKETMDFIHDLFPLKHAPSANSEYAWLYRLLKRYKSPKKNSLTEDVEDVQGNDIAALDPSQEADQVLTRSSKPVVTAVLRTQKILIQWILTMRSWRPLLILTTLLLLLPSSRFHPYSLHLNLHTQHARGGSNDSSDEDMASYDGDSNCHSDEDEDDDRSPVYATRSLAHGVKQPTLNCR